MNIERLPSEARAVLDYWLGDALTLDWPSTDRYPLWFHGHASTDAEIEWRFAGLVQQALHGLLRGWERTPLGRLALVIVLDQFTRNIYRGTAWAFAGDRRAQQVVHGALEAHDDDVLPLAARVFLYMPLEHAEDPALQVDSVRRFRAMAEQAPPALHEVFAVFLAFARQHRDIVARFGRFPHRNAALGRVSTPEEEVFLMNGPRFGQ